MIVLPARVLLRVLPVVFSFITRYNKKKKDIMDMKIIAQKTAYHAKRNKYKIILGAPILFAIFVNIDIATSTPNIMSVESTNTVFVTVGDTVTIDVDLETTGQINAVGGDIIFEDMFLMPTSIRSPTRP